MEHMAFQHLVILGVAILGGLLGADFFRKIRCPQVIGYIVIGVLIGQSGFGLIKAEEIRALELFNLFALGIIGFLVGGELQIQTFKQYGRQFAAILLGEGLAAFLLVGLSIGLLAYFVFGSLTQALAVGIVFGAIASATDPASTISVLWENRALGVLTSSLTAIVALDDALAMTLYGLGTGLAQVLIHQSGSVMGGLLMVWIELLGSVALGILSGCILNLILRWVTDPERSLAFAIGLMLLVIGIAVSLDLDVILAAMSLGFVVGNYSPRRSEELFKITRGFSISIYVLFFVLVGARLSFSSMPWWLWVMVGLYVAGRSAGKMAGAWLGARWTGSESVVRRYLGMGLFAQGGVAIGLSIMASQHLGAIQITETLSLGDVIIFGVAATTFIVQLVGPPMVKWAIQLSDETNRNVTRDDIIAEWSAREVMADHTEFIREDEPLEKVVRKFTDQDLSFYPVVDRRGILIGGLSLTMLKEVLVDQDAWQWLLASDVMRSVDHKVYPETPLSDVLDLMNAQQIQHVPVVDSESNNVPMGVINDNDINNRITREILKRRQLPQANVAS